jgi:hypothetical protein
MDARRMLRHRLASAEELDICIGRRRRKSWIVCVRLRQAAANIFVALLQAFP